MSDTWFKALCPYDRTPVRQEGKDYRCPKCGRLIKSSELAWKRTDKSKKNSSHSTRNAGVP